jgi:hypothetical protein
MILFAVNVRLQNLDLAAYHKTERMTRSSLRVILISVEPRFVALVRAYSLCPGGQTVTEPDRALLMTCKI